MTNQNQLIAVDASAQLNAGMQLHKLGKLSEAEAAYTLVPRASEQYADACSLLGMVYQVTGRIKQGLVCMNDALAIAQLPVYLSRRAALFTAMERADLAIEDAKKAIKLDPGFEEAYVNLLGALRLAKEVKKAIQVGKHAVKMFPRNADLWNNFGAVLLDKGDFEGALDAFHSCVETNPSHLRGLENLARVSWVTGKNERASQWSEKAHVLGSIDTQVLMPWMQSLIDANKHSELAKQVWFECVTKGDEFQLKKEAETPDFQNRSFEYAAQYQRVREYGKSHELLLKITQLRPDSPQAWNNLGVSYYAEQDYRAALTYFQKAAALDPNSDMMERNIGVCHFLLIEPELARQHFEAAYRKNSTSMANALYHFGQSLQCVEWSRYHENKNHLINLALHQPADDLTASLAFLAATEKAADMRIIAKKVGTSLFGTAQCEALPKRGKRAEGQRIRVGYLSYDFRTHPVTYLTEELYKLHDRSKVEIYALSYGPDDGSVFRKTVERDVDHFVDLENVTEQDMVDRIRALEIDILVDLTGNTQGGKSRLLAKRVAPIQAHWLGYVWSMGHVAYDYIIADAFSVPPECELGYIEKPARMPYTLQIASRNLKPSEKRFTRQDFCLPKDAIVLCNFGSFGKLQPDLFGAWMAVLHEVPNAVLWLARTHRTPPEAFDRLREFVKSCGVDPSRVIYSDPIGREEHLRRYELADLALDTYPQGSGTTAIEALFMGCPMLSMAGAGETLAIRMAGGILKAAGLDNMVVNSQQAYQDLAIELSRNPEKLKKMREHLLANQGNLPLFDTPRTVKYLEAAYQAMWSRHEKGLEPTALDVIA